MANKTIYDAVHQRWGAELNRDMGSPAYREEWRVEQCFNCKYHLKLAGEFGEDWGVCANPKSTFDRRVMFEHDGCSEHAPAYV